MMSKFYTVDNSDTINSLKTFTNNPLTVTKGLFMCNPQLVKHQTST